jgi:two-component system LytT family response regulator
MTSLVRRALLIDDEPLARLELRRLLQAHPAVTISGEGGTMAEARELLAHRDYDLVFLDIQLRGGSGFDLVERVHPGAQVVFVTAYDRFALRAFEVNALDYLLKPVTPARLAATLERLGAVRLPAAPLPVAKDAENRLTAEDRVFVRADGGTRFLAVNAICAIRSCENYSELVLADGSTLLVLRTLKSWEQSLPETLFVRIHRQTIVNLSHVKAITRGDEEELLFTLDAPGPALPASRRQVAELRHRCAALGLDGLLP